MRLCTHNPDIDPLLLEQRVRTLVLRRRESILFDAGTSSAVVPDTPLTPYLQPDTGLLLRVKHYVNGHPSLRALLLPIYRFSKGTMTPSIPWRQRARRIPVVGSIAAWIRAILLLNPIRAQIQHDFNAVRRELHELREANRQFQQESANLQTSVQQQLQVLEAARNDLRNDLQLLLKLEIQARLNALELQNVHTQHHINATDARLQIFDSVDIAVRLSQLESSSRQLEEASRAHANLIASVLRAHRVVPAIGAQGRAEPLAEALTETDPAGYASYYIGFEDAFRGSSDAIQEKLSIYLPYLPGAGERTTDRALVVDIGCGRGEWLTLLRSQAIPGIGVDINASMVQACREEGLQVAHQDAIKFLLSQPAESLAAVTGFHLIEHLDLPAILALMDAALHALRPDGILILETPNPENLLVGACNFYTDLTHRHPIVPAVAQFMARQRGFARSEILRLHPYPADHHILETSVAAQRLNHLLYGPQDFALLAWKTHAP